ncbi:conserved hypothetical protein, partial [Ricinus communis]
RGIAQPGLKAVQKSGVFGQLGRGAVVVDFQRCRRQAALAPVRQQLQDARLDRRCVEARQLAVDAYRHQQRLAGAGQQFAVRRDIDPAAGRSQFRSQHMPARHLGVGGGQRGAQRGSPLALPDIDILGQRRLRCRAARAGCQQQGAQQEKDGTTPPARSRRRRGKQWMEEGGHERRRWRGEWVLCNWTALYVSRARKTPGPEPPCGLRAWCRASGNARGGYAGLSLVALAAHRHERQQHAQDGQTDHVVRRALRIGLDPQRDQHRGQAAEHGIGHVVGEGQAGEAHRRRECAGRDDRRERDAAHEQAHQRVAPHQRLGRAGQMAVEPEGGQAQAAPADDHAGAGADAVAQPADGQAAHGQHHGAGA